MLAGREHGGDGTRFQDSTLLKARIAVHLSGVATRCHLPWLCHVEIRRGKTSSLHYDECAKILLALAPSRVWSRHEHIEDGEKLHFSAFDAEAEHVFDSLAVFALIDICYVLGK